MNEFWAQNRILPKPRVMKEFTIKKILFYFLTEKSGSFINAAFNVLQNPKPWTSHTVLILVSSLHRFFFFFTITSLSLWFDFYYIFSNLQNYCIQQKKEWIMSGEEEENAAELKIGDGKFAFSFFYH